MSLGTKTVTLALAAAGALLASSAAPAIGTPHVRSTSVSTPQLIVKMSGKHSSLNVTGPHRFSAGRVGAKLTAGKGEQAFEVFRLRNGYTLHDFDRDLAKFDSSQQPTPAGLKAFNRLVRHTVFCGGLDTGNGHKSVSGSLVLPTADTYYMFNTSEGPDPSVTPLKLHVTARTGGRATPAVDGVIKATNAKRFRGSVNLPAAGTVEFDNASTNSPHLMFLQHVKKGTTREQVIKALQSNGPGPMLPGGAGIDVVSPGRTATLTYALRAGDYAVMCFFPDLKTGMPHAFMGMVRIVHLA